MAIELAKQFGPSAVFSIGYYPQFDSITIYVEHSKWKDVEYNKKVAEFLNSKKVERLNAGMSFKDVPNK